MLLTYVPHGVRLIALNLQMVMTFEINFTMILFSWWRRRQSCGFLFAQKLNISVPKTVTRAYTWLGAFIFSPLTFDNERPTL